MTSSYDVSVIYLTSKSDVKDLKNYIEPYFKYMEKEFYEFSSKLTFPISIVYERNYVDRVFRDCYYHMFASKHFEIPKNCQRIALFEGCISLSDFYKSEKQATLKDSIIGTIVIRPLKDGAWGRTLINPQKLNQDLLYIRTTQFYQIINGIEFTINAYPFSSQDTEMMSCAETSIWTMLYYYGTRYPEYRTVLPSEIISEVSLSSQQRSLPTQGLTYLQKSNLLKKFGFSPRVYSRDVYEDLDTKRLFHYYVESGIPLTISLDGHSTVCIGHAKANISIADIPSCQLNLVNDFIFVDSADLHNKYVIIDDNQYPYKVETYDDFSIHNTSKQLKLFTVPLYKRIFLEADAAKRIFDRVVNLIFGNTTFQFIQQYFETLTGGKSEPIVERMFLTSSRKYKAFRIIKAANEYESNYYLSIPYPKFVWVMELSSGSSYETYDKKVLGEIVLDATSSKYSKGESIISMRIGKIFTYRMPNEDDSFFYKRIVKRNEINDRMQQYVNNLIEVV